MATTYLFLAFLLLAALIIASDNNNRPGGCPELVRVSGI